MKDRLRNCPGVKDTRDMTTLLTMLNSELGSFDIRAITGMIGKVGRLRMR